MSSEFDALGAEIERLDGSPDEAAAASLAALLAHRSWSLRDRVVDALARRPLPAPHVIRVVEEGEWWARASACDVLARRPHVTAVPALLRAIVHRNVSLQRSAVRALLAVSESCGVRALTDGVGTLVPEDQRRVIARLGHQAPHWIDEFLEAIASSPRVAGAEAASIAPPSAAPIADAETQTLREFRSWLLARAADSGRGMSAP